MSANYRPENELDGAKATSLAQKLKDIWWRVCTNEGNILNLPIIIWGANGLPEAQKSTPATELGYQKLNNAVLRDKLNKQDEKLDRIIAKLGA